MSSPSLSERTLGNQGDFEAVSAILLDKGARPDKVNPENPEKPSKDIVAGRLSFNPGQATVPVTEGYTRGLVKHDRFFFDDGNAIFLVESTAYRLHKYFFVRDSATFVSCFNEKEHVVKLDGVRKDEMDAFLKVLYPIDFKARDISTLEEWTAVHRLSNMWGFATLRSLAVEQLEGLTSPVDKIVLGRAYDIRAWLEPAFIALGARANPLTIEEGRRLGVDDTVTVFHIRQRRRPPSARPLASSPSHNPMLATLSPQRPQNITPPSPLPRSSLAPHPAHNDSTPQRFTAPPVISDLISSLAPDNFDTTLDRVVEWANRRQATSSETPALAYRQLVALTFQKAASKDEFIGLGADFCERLTERAHPSISDHHVLEKSGRAIQGKKLVRTYIQQRSITTIHYWIYHMSTIHDKSAVARPSAAEIHGRYQHVTRFCQFVAELFKGEIVPREIGLQAVGLLVDSVVESPGHEGLAPLCALLPDIGLALKDPHSSWSEMHRLTARLRPVLSEGDRTMSPERKALLQRTLALRERGWKSRI
ncbi:hypothetical protein OF83DRAFT_1170120 [Amylostereum chailletii]|nr:hypothetical protein OF83DRAFT_1170120 [Amylostereum chailletii]